MRSWAILAMAAAASTAISGEQFPGAKADLATSTAQVSGGGSGLMPLFQMAIVAGLILLFLKFWLPKVLGKLSKRVNPKMGGSIRIEESADFAGGTLYVAQVRKKTLLLCSSGSGVQCLADLTEAENTDSEPRSFAETLQAASADQEPRTEAAPTPSPELRLDGGTRLKPEEIEAVLGRARRLVA